MIKYIDLFCGIGSFHYSFKKLNWICVMACDINNDCRKTYNHNFKLEPLEDINDIVVENIPQYDILCAGFPCQPFSNCGKHAGEKDPRAHLFFNIMKFVYYHKPKIIILENVPALIKDPFFEKINSIIIQAGYTLIYKILKCSDYGIPQMRKRLFIIAIKDGDACKMQSILNCDKYKKDITLSVFFNKKFEKKTAYTIRCGGRNSKINDKHNWDGYFVDNQEYRLSIDDALKLQGFRNFELFGSDTQKWKQLGNTIPTIFTEMISMNIKDFLSL